MNQRMVVTELKQGESGWSVELKTIGEDGVKDYRGFAVLPLTEDQMALVRVGTIVEMVGAIPEVVS